MTDMTFSRRGFLTLGCSAAAFPLITPVALAAAPWDARLVVLILRGGMDGLGVIQPYGDRDFAGMRQGALAAGPDNGAKDLDGFFALMPYMKDLMPLWRKGELAFAHAVSTPYRDRRSHFDGQDLLEAGTGWSPGAPIARDGWLNRMLQAVPGVEAQTAYAIGREDLLLAAGPAPVANWAPDTKLRMSAQAADLLRLVSEGSPLFAEAIEEAIDLAAEEAAVSDDILAGETGANMGSKSKKNGTHLKMVDFAVRRLQEETRIAAFSLNGWDTHNNQSAAIRRPALQLAETLVALKEGMGDLWGKTMVLAMTEFGRTARQNGTTGTDHGTGGAMLMAGGALRGGKVYADWPGLAEADLYDRRDLRPTADVRAYAASAMRGLFGLDQSILEQAVFPGLDMGAVPNLVL